MTTTISREELIEAVANAARRPCPKIAERYNYRDRETGKEYGPLAVPFGFDRSRLDRVSVGFAYTDANGSAFGTRYPSREAAIAAHEQREARNAENFRRELAGMDNARLESQAEYWLS